MSHGEPDHPVEDEEADGPQQQGDEQAEDRVVEEHDATLRPPPERDRGFGDGVYLVCMTRLNVYLPDDLAAQAKEAGLNLSAVTREAVRRTLAARSTDSWLSTLPMAAAGAVSHDRALEALDAARDEPPTRHG